MNQCPCCSDLDYDQCCGRFIEQGLLPETPEELMRSRYCAYTRGYVKYIKHTMCGNAAQHFDYLSAQQWAKKVQWIGLKVVNTEFSENSEDKGFVEFIACFSRNEKPEKIHEISEFHRIEGKWFYVDGMPQ